jgi:hypothetical protein
MKVLSSVWVPGFGAALSSIGFGAITAFSALLFVAHGWAPCPAFTVFAAAFIPARLFLAHLADQFAAAKVALLTVLVEAVGLAPACSSAFARGRTCAQNYVRLCAGKSVPL